MFLQGLNFYGLIEIKIIDEISEKNEIFWQSFPEPTSFAKYKLI